MATRMYLHAVLLLLQLVEVHSGRHKFLVVNGAIAIHICCGYQLMQLVLSQLVAHLVHGHLQAPGEASPTPHATPALLASLHPQQVPTLTPSIPTPVLLATWHCQQLLASPSIDCREPAGLLSILQSACCCQRLTMRLHELAHVCTLTQTPVQMHMESGKGRGPRKGGGGREVGGAGEQFAHAH